MDQLINYGVDGIITDYPDRLREVMKEHKFKMPKSHKSPKV